MGQHDSVDALHPVRLGCENRRVLVGDGVRDRVQLTGEPA
jgi:hypothetical protein